MARWEHHDTRDLTYSHFHRLIPSPCRMIDLDHIEYCPYCFHALAFVELAQDIGQGYKATTITRNMAEDAQKRGYLTFYQKDSLKAHYDRAIAGKNLEDPAQALAAWDELSKVPDKLFRVRRVYPIDSSGEERLMNPAEYREFLVSLHQQHEKTCAGKKR